MKIIRQSMLNAYEKCPYSCKLDWGDVGEDSPVDNLSDDDNSNKYARAGIALHETMEWWGNERIAGRYPLLIECHRMLDERFNIIPPELFEDNDDRNEFYNSLHEQLEWIYEQSHLIIPISVEKDFHYEGLINELPPISGTIDRIEGSIESRSVDIVDYKTGKVYTKRELSTNMQAALYSLAFYNEYKFFPDRFIFMFSKYKKIKTVHITQEFLTNATTRIFSIYQKMKNGIWNQNTKNKFFCKNFCNHFKECPKYAVKGWEGVGFERFRPYSD